MYAAFKGSKTPPSAISGVFGFSYDVLSRRTQLTRPNSVNTNYQYDTLSRLTSALHQLNSTTLDGATYTYDANGNMLTKTPGSSVTNYACDFESRLETVTLPGSGGTVNLKYDPFGRRVEKISPSGAITIYAYDGDNVIEELDSTGTATARYAQSLGIDEPLAELRSGATSFYEADGLGSITSLTDSTGARANTYIYDSFGYLYSSTGSVTNPFQFTARELDSETGLYYYRARYYDPTVGRFVSEDPIGFKGGMNFYRYARNSPVNSKDPTGLSCDMCKACPSGSWSGAGISYGGILLSGGIFSGQYKVSCWGKKLSCWITTTCAGLGLGLGGSVSAESIWIDGACSPNDLSGSGQGGVVTGGLGVAGAGGSISAGKGPKDPQFNSNSSGVTYGAGVGAGGGYVLGKCTTTVLSCTH